MATIYVTAAGKDLCVRAEARGMDVVVDDVILTTDILFIYQRFKEPWCVFLRRSEVLAVDATPVAPVMTDRLESLEGPTQIVLLQAASPLWIWGY